MDTAITHGESVMHFLPVKRWFGHQKCDTLQYWRSYRPTTSISCVCPGLSESVYWKCPQPPQKCQKPAKKPEIIFYTHVLRQYLCYAHQKTFSSSNSTLVSIAEQRTLFFELSVLENQYSSAYFEGLLPVFMRYNCNGMHYTKPITKSNLRIKKFDKNWGK